MAIWHRLPSLLLFFAVIASPFSLAYHWNEAAGMVAGVRVDYQIPHVSASAILMGTALLALARWRKQLSIPTLQRTLQHGCMTALVIQAIFVGYQYGFQRSLTGYLPFGEVRLQDPAVAKGVTPWGSIYTLPYGTTVHPNVLAGWTCCMVLIIWMLSRKHNALPFLLLGMCIIILTQAWAAGIALGVGLLLSWLPHDRKSAHIITALWGIPLLVMLFLQLPMTDKHALTSIARRAQLQDIALSMVEAHPITGVGWNGFTRHMEEYGFVVSPIRFIQPVHHVPLLLISELGVVGVCFIALLIVATRHTPTKLVPLVGALIIIGCWDHYLVTLTTGRLLLLFPLLLFLLTRGSRDKIVT